MSDKSHSALSTFLASRKENLRLAFMGIVAALAVSILAGSAVAYFSQHIAWLTGFATIILALVVFLIFRDLAEKMKFEDTIRGVLFFDKDGILLSIRRYKFSESFSRTLQAIEAENKAIHSEWAKHPVIAQNDIKPQDKEKKEGDDAEKKATDAGEDVTWYSVVKVTEYHPDTRDNKPSIKLLEEIVAFNVLEELSLHLSSYFNDHDEEDERLVELSRSDIPEFLLQNRVLNMLCTPIEQREVFLKAFPETDKRPEGEIHSLFGSNGAMYQRFDLILPKGSKLTQYGVNGFTVTTNRFVLNIEVQYGGFAQALPDGFGELYLQSNPRDLETRSVDIKLSGRIFTQSMFSRTGWQYHGWLDSFRKRINDSYHIKTFFKKINWDIVSPIYQVGIPMFNRMKRKE